MDFLYGEQDNVVLYGGDGDDILMVGGKSAGVIYGGDGDDFLRRPPMGSEMSSIAVKAGTNTLPRRSTMCPAVARKAGSSIPAALPCSSSLARRFVARFWCSATWSAPPNGYPRSC